jgi:hypothetical protein
MKEDKEDIDVVIILYLPVGILAIEVDKFSNQTHTLFTSLT